jgi:hypothetical protein
VSDAQEITTPFNDPYYTGGGAGSGNASAFDFMPVSLEGVPFLVDLASKQYERKHLQLLRSKQNRAPKDSLFIEPEIWRAVIESWHHGEGQSRYDREDSMPYRFSQSQGIDVWNKWGIQLLHDTEKTAALGGSSKPFMAVVKGEQLFVGFGNAWLWWENFEGSPNTQRGGTLEASIVGLTTDGAVIYIALANGKVQKVVPNAGSDPTFSDKVTLPGVKELWYLKGFLVAAVGNRLDDITGTPRTIFTHPLSAFKWIAGADGPAFSYLLGGMGDKWFVYKMGLLDDATSFSPPAVATTLPEGEVGYGLGGYLGYMLVGTERGVRFMTPQGDGSLVYGQLVETERPVRCFEGQGRFVWFGVDAVPATPTMRFLPDGVAGLGRMDLSQFTAPLTPAVASDLVAAGDVGKVWSVATVGQTNLDFPGSGRRVILTSNGVYREADELVSVGTIQQGVLNMDVANDKRAQYAQITFEPLAGGSVEFSMSWDGAPFVSIAAASNGGGVSMGNIQLSSKQFVGAIPKFTLTRSPDDPTVGPRMTRFELRAQAELGKAHEWSVPLILSDLIDFDSVTTPRSIRDDFDHLVSLVETGRLFKYREAGREFEVYAVGERWVPTHLSRDGQEWNGVYVIQLREAR